VEHAEKRAFNAEARRHGEKTRIGEGQRLGVRSLKNSRLPWVECGGSGEKLRDRVELAGESACPTLLRKRVI
jgi:hypothetical protein